MVVKKQARTVTRLGYRHATATASAATTQPTLRRPDPHQLKSAPQTPAPPSTPSLAPPQVTASRAPMGLSPSPRRRAE